MTNIPDIPELNKILIDCIINELITEKRRCDPGSDVCIGHFNTGNVFRSREDITNEDLKNILNKLLNKLDRGEESFYYFDFTDFRVKETRYDSVGANRLVDIGNCVKSAEEFTDKKLKTILDNIKKKLE